MNKSQKSLFIFCIILLIYWNLSSIYGDLFFNLISIDSFIFMFLRSIPMLILLTYYFCNILLYPSEKLSVNYTFLALCLLTLIIIAIYKLLYYYLLIPKISNMFLGILYLLFAIFFILAYYKNLKKKECFSNQLSWIAFILLFIQIFFLLFVRLGFPFETSHNNPNSYEFIRYHELTDKEFAGLPNTLPEDATNIILNILLLSLILK